MKNTSLRQELFKKTGDFLLNFQTNSIEIHKNRYGCYFFKEIKSMLLGEG